jgi:hypothetical protein
VRPRLLVRGAVNYWPPIIQGHCGEGYFASCKIPPQGRGGTLLAANNALGLPRKTHSLHNGSTQWQASAAASVREGITVTVH